MTIDIVRALRGYLLTLPNIADYFDYGGPENWDIFIFQDDLMTRLQSSQKTALVVSQNGNWSTPNVYNTMRFPRIVTEYYSDPPRNAANNVVTAIKAKERILAAHEYVDSFLHSVDGEVWWPAFGDARAVRIPNTNRAGELQFFDVPGGDGLLRATCPYNVIMC